MTGKASPLSNVELTGAQQLRAREILRGHVPV
jgi:hypothetical protein